MQESVLGQEATTPEFSVKTDIIQNPHLPHCHSDDRRAYQMLPSVVIVIKDLQVLIRFKMEDTMKRSSLTFGKGLVGSTGKVYSNNI